MTKTSKAIILIVTLAIIVAGGAYYKNSKQAPTPEGDAVIVTSSGVFYRSGNALLTNPPLPVTHGGYNSTTTNQVAVTLLAAELEGASTINVLASSTPQDVTVRFPATSTLSSAFIPRTGQWTDITFKNASTTAGVDVGLIAGTGWNFFYSSSTKATTTQSGLINVRAIRKANTDIDAFITPAIN